MLLDSRPVRTAENLYFDSTVSNQSKDFHFAFEC